MPIAQVYIPSMDNLEGTMEEIIKILGLRRFFLLVGMLVETRGDDKVEIIHHVSGKENPHLDVSNRLFLAREWEGHLICCWDSRVQVAAPPGGELHSEQQHEGLYHNLAIFPPGFTKEEKNRALVLEMVSP